MRPAAPATSASPRWMLGFSAPAWQRAAWAGVYTVIAFSAVAWLDRPAAPTATVGDRLVAPLNAGTTQLTMVLEATSQVAGWTVRLDGRDVAGVGVTAQSWRGQALVDAKASHELFVNVEMAQQDLMQPAAVRLVVEGARMPIERLWWVEDGALFDRLVVPAGGGRP